MSKQNKAVEAYWTNNIPHPFSSTSLPWGGGNHRQMVKKEIPEITPFLKDQGEDARQILLLGVFKIVLFKYLNERNICINQFNRAYYLPSLVPVDPDLTVKAFIQALEDNFRKSRKMAIAGYDQVIEKYRIRFGPSIGDAFYQFALLYDHTPYTEELEKHGLICRVTPAAGNFELSIEYFSGSPFSSDFLGLFINNFIYLLQNIDNQFDKRIAEIDIRSDFEKRTASSASLAKTGPAEPLHRIFEDIVQIFPDNIALKYGNDAMTYAELNRRSNRVAKALIRKGVRKRDIVGILVQRNMEMVTGILAILKAGACYMPIDPAYPADRIQYMLKDSDAGILLTDMDDPGLPGIETLRIDSISNREDDGTNPGLDVDPRSFAYIIYTSGTTGRPKGVLISHYNVTSLLFCQQYFNFNQRHTWTLFHSFCFDVSVWEIFGALLHGGRLVILPAATTRDPENFLRVLEKEKVNVLCQTPTAFLNLMPYGLKTGALDLDFVIFAGEPLNFVKLKEWKRHYPRTKLINMYGITETTIHSTLKEVTPADIEKEVSNIGTGLPHLEVFIAGGNGEELPVGATGEIFVGGNGVSRGYLNRPELTHARFMQVPSPVEEGLLYRSGDLARRLPSGELEYLGRRDNQVKIHGFRIELEEVEANLLQIDQISNVVVLARELQGQKCLCAWFEASGEIDTEELKNNLRSRLPHYMVPTHFMRLPRIPLTINGKKDKNNLPDPELASNARFAPPRTEKEIILSEIWKDIFGTKEANIFYEFYALGGDSIKAIRLKSNLLNYGYTIEITDILKSNSLHLIAERMIPTTTLIDQAPVEGEVPLSPIQIRFLKHNLSHHSNQAVLLQLHEPIPEDVLASIFHTLVGHHDALRMRVVEGSKAIIEKEIPLSLAVYDTGQQEDGNYFISGRISEIQRSIRLSDTPLIKLALFTSGKESRLFIAIHHFVVDGLSWRILLDDFSTLYRQWKEGVPFQLPLKTNSIAQWNARLHELAGSGELRGELGYWQDICQRQHAGIFSGRSVSGSFEKDYSSVSFDLGPRYGESLLGKANAAYNTTAEDLLIGSLYLAVREKYGMNSLLLALEHHGRVMGLQQVEVSRTIGWFTTVFPFYMGLAGKDIPETIKETKALLKTLPGSGIGYGILKYIGAAGEASKLDYRADIEFNYLGHFNQGPDNGVFSVLSYAAGDLRHERYRHDTPVLINVLVDEMKSIRVEILFDHKLIMEEEMEELAGSYKHSIIGVIDHCTGTAAIASGYPVDSLYPLTPAQEGILFHDLISPDANVYFGQASYLYNDTIELPLLEKSLDQLSKRHELLRSVYLYQDLDRPVQVILQEQPVGRQYEDISQLPEEEKASQLERIRIYDRNVRFDPSRGPLLRLCLVKMEETRYCFVWSYHHLIMDGWCLDIINSELFGIYASLKGGPGILPAPEFGKFIHWLEKRDTAGDQSYWMEFLKGFEEQAKLPSLKADPGARKNFNHVTEIFSPVQERMLRQLSAAYRVPVNSLVQIAWGWTLSRYTGKKDIVFGLIVSGRPPEIKDVERMIGMFINTIPQRVNFSDAKDIVELAKALQDQAISSIDHHHYPLARLKKDRNSRDIFDHIVNYISFPAAGQVKLFNTNDGDWREKISGLEVFEQTHYDFALKIVDTDTITVRVDFNENMYHPFLVKQIIADFLFVLEQIAGGTRDLNDIEALHPAHRHRLLQEFNPAPTGVRDRKAHQLFEEQVEKTPGHIAITDNICQLTYRQLNEKADQLAILLKGMGIRRQSVIALIADRSVDAIVCILGILKAGCIYLPIEADYPLDRIQYLLNDAAADHIVAGESAIVQLRSKGLNFINECITDNNISVICLNPAGSGGDEQEPEYAYVLYTSGSTGLPKGVLIRHRSIVNFIESQRKVLGISEEDKVLQLSSLCFDTSVEDIFLSLSCGARLVLIGKQTYLDENAFADFVNMRQVTSIHTVPSFIAHMRPGNLRHLKRLLTGGEVCPPVTAEEWLGNLDFYNSYGPTETTVTATQSLIGKQSDYCLSVTIGSPISNVRIYILDPAMRLMPVGCPGEIYIGGEGLAAGYINRTELTDNVFPKNPFEPGERIYKTGDLGRWLPDGNIEFLGRVDRQVKIRGYRIELAEIEYHIRHFCDFREVIVLPYQKANKESILAVYFVSDIKVDRKSLKKYLAGKLPEYMVPGRFVEVDSIPLTYNGKVDVDALRRIRSQADEGDLPLTIQPATLTQQALIGIWKETLDLDTISIHDNFFDLGGTSIDMMTVSGRLGRHYDIDNLLVKMFQYTTISALAAYIDSVKNNAESGRLAEEPVQEVEKDIKERRKRMRYLRN